VFVAPLLAQRIMLQPGTQIGSKYRIVRLMGEGGMGSVYEAEHLVLGSRVALKFLHPEIAEQPSLKQRFLQEARVSATVEDEHIARVTDVDTSPEGAYLVMELLKGEPLTNLVEREGRLDVEPAVHFALQIGKGLRAAHARSIVHRDLKPDNVFVTHSSNGPLLKLLDFGIAKLRESQEFQMTLTRPGSVMGTPEYMAPEQAFGAETVDHRSDIYSLGVMLFEMLSGRLPIEGSLPQEIAERILQGRVLHLADLRPELPRELIHIVERAMQPRPEARFRDIEEMSHALISFAPPMDRLSAGTPMPGMARGYATGLATPFTPVAVTPYTGQISKGAVSSSQASQPFPNTLPPESDGPPAASRLPEAPRVRTQSMPEAKAMHSIAMAPTAFGSPGPATIGKMTSAPKTQSSGFVWWLLAATLLGSAIFALVYFEPFAPELETPPQPSARPRPTNVLVESAPDDFDDSDLTPISEDKPRPVRGGSPVGPELPQLPPITFPTELPQIPPGLPTELPRLPQIPGFPAPGLTGSNDQQPR
jgi:eukaryotic-like serine/threonine-protein kinase